MEILLIILIFGLCVTAFPFCFYKMLDVEDLQQSLRWMVATLGVLGLVLALGITGAVVYGS